MPAHLEVAAPRKACGKCVSANLCEVPRRARGATYCMIASATSCCVSRSPAAVQFVCCDAKWPLLCTLGELANFHANLVGETRRKDFRPLYVQMETIAVYLWRKLPRKREYPDRNASLLAQFLDLLRVVWFQAWWNKQHNLDPIGLAEIVQLRQPLLRHFQQHGWIVDMRAMIGDSGCQFTEIWH